jgi:hypothetical protein
MKELILMKLILIPVVTSWVDLDRLEGRGRPWLSFLAFAKVC